MNFYQKLSAASITLLLVMILFCVAPARARNLQHGRDHLTDQEADLVREAQALDLRMEVFIKAADRRVLRLTRPNTLLTPKLQQQETETLGELTGTRLDLLSD